MLVVRGRTQELTHKIKILNNKLSLNAYVITNLPRLEEVDSYDLVRQYITMIIHHAYFCDRQPGCVSVSRVRLTCIPQADGHRAV